MADDKEIQAEWHKRDQREKMSADLQNDLNKKREEAENV